MNYALSMFLGRLELVAPDLAEKLQKSNRFDPELVETRLISILCTPTLWPAIETALKEAWQIPGVESYLNHLAKELKQCGAEWKAAKTLPPPYGAGTRYGICRRDQLEW